jgi:hypothetical protein
VIGNEEFDRRVLVHRRSGFAGGFAVDGDLARQNQRPGALARWCEPAIDDELIEAKLCHVNFN